MTKDLPALLRNQNPANSDARYLEILGDCSRVLGMEAELHFIEDVADDLPSKNGSPIERLVGIALAFSMRSRRVFGGEGWGEGIGWPWGRPDSPVNFVPANPGLSVWFQAPVGRYRADFLICASHDRGGYAWGAIECDGHDHHDLTKDQAQRDRARDRFFQSQGIIILRYTGSEIWRAPLLVVFEAVNLLMNRAAEPSARRWGA